MSTIDKHNENLVNNNRVKERKKIKNKKRQKKGEKTNKTPNN